MRAGRLIAVAAALAVALGVPPAAEAAFPGRNGMLAYTVFRDKGDCGERIDCLDQRIWVVDPSVGNPAQLAIECQERDCDDSDAAWSPDGMQMAFVRGPFSPDSGVLVGRADGSEPRRITEGGDPAWSAGGDKLAVEGRSDLFVVSADGSSRRRLTYRGGRNPAWSSSDRIVFERASPFRRRGLYAVNPDGTGLERVTRHGDWSPEWSPDGRRLAFERQYSRGEDGFVMEVAVIRASGGRVRRLTRGGGHYPAWSPDGERIAFTRGRRLMVLSLDTGRVRTLVTLPRKRAFRGLDWQPLP